MVQSPDVYEPTTTEPVSETVVRALAEATDRQPIDLDLQLYDALDPDALDKLYDDAAGRSGPRVAFTIGPHRVVVDESRRVHVTTASDGAGTTGYPRTPAGQALRGSASPWRPAYGTF